MSHPIDPAMQTILAAIQASPAIDLRAMPMAAARRAFITGQTPWAWAPRPLAAITDLTVPGPGGAIPARLYRPTLALARPVVIVAHGGGWTFGSIETHDGMMRSLALESGCVVLGIDYRLAPEHPFPAPLDDLLAALAFVEGGGLGDVADPARIALAGDSAGANLALGALVARRDAGARLPVTAALFYGCFAPIFDTPSNRRNGDGRFLLRTEMMRWYWSNFLGEASPEDPPKAAAPLWADMAGFPPLYLNAAGLDPLLDDTLMLSAGLAAAGIRHRLDVWPGVVHGFLRFARELPAARAALAAAGRHLADTLNPG